MNVATFVGLGAGVGVATGFTSGGDGWRLGTLTGGRKRMDGVWSQLSLTNLARSKRRRGERAGRLFNSIVPREN